MKTVTAFRIWNFRNANKSIQLVLNGTDHFDVHFNQSQGDSFTSACNMLLSSQTVLFDEVKTLFIVESGSNLTAISDELNS